MNSRREVLGQGSGRGQQTPRQARGREAEPARHGIATAHERAGVDENQGEGASGAGDGRNAEARKKKGRGTRFAMPYERGLKFVGGKVKQLFTGLPNRSLNF